jgi:hypothetical protein
LEKRREGARYGSFVTPPVSQDTVMNALVRRLVDFWLDEEIKRGMDQLFDRLIEAVERTT